MTDWLGLPRWPTDPVAVVAAVLAVAGAIFVAGWRARAARLVAALPTWAWVAILAVTAAALSCGYTAHFLRGGPRIIDATSYWLEARSFAAGGFTFAPPGPLASFGGRFLVAPADADRLGVIFPPGYPALLALGFLAGAPLAVGPLLAAGLVITTFALGRATARRDDVALLAAALSTLSVALRYHTADTMSHGWAALLASLALLGALRGTPAAALGAGLAAGWLVATRPFSGLVFAVLAAAVLAASPRRLPLLALGCLPGIVLLLAHQQAVTGEPWSSSQVRYYALADGPPGCFHYGFGGSIGCRYEHGDFVGSLLPDGFGPWQALCVTGIRLFMHLRDAGNSPLLAPLIVLGAVGARRQRRLAWPALGVAGIVLVYAPFYFDGSYPGGGARLYADALPLEHVLLAQGLFAVRLAALAVPLVLGGFALVTSTDHRALSVREVGRPYFEPAVLAAAGVERGLVFVDTDHGFNLGHDPRVRSAADGVVVARLRGDANDRLLWDALGRPAAFAYAGPVQGRPPELVPRAIPTPPALRYEAESHWPLGKMRDGWAHPDFPPCASRTGGLRFRATGAPAAIAGFAVEVPREGRYRIETGWAAAAEVSGLLGVQAPGIAAERRYAKAEGSCWVLSLGEAVLRAGTVPFEFRAEGTGAVLDYVELLPVERPASGPTTGDREVGTDPSAR